ncbi:MAG: pantetheine-phosphate adenylyltransferase [Bacteroidales bacterium]|nr:pantetheine-phosphate adenylyltransferase [Bacteroidales bacterium]
MRKVVFPGTFDPFTRGHQSIVNRVLLLADEVVIAIGINESKHQELTIDQRVEAIRRLYADEPRVSVVTYQGLTMDLCREQGAQCIVRGIRSVQDFEYERNLADCNRKLSGVETILLFTEPEYSMISSSNVRELLHYGKDITEFMPI